MTGFDNSIICSTKKQKPLDMLSGGFFCYIRGPLKMNAICQTTIRKPL